MTPSIALPLLGYRRIVVRGIVCFRGAQHNIQAQNAFSSESRETALDWTAAHRAHSFDALCAIGSTHAGRRCGLCGRWTLVLGLAVSLMH